VVLSEASILSVICIGAVLNGISIEAAYQKIHCLLKQ